MRAEVTPRRAAASEAALPFRLALPRGPVGGMTGERLGSGTGSSLDLQDVRDYVPGDDLRHLDWRAFARTDRLQVRLYRDEIAPWVDVVLDRSASMGVTDQKAAALRDLLTILRATSERAGGKPRLLAAAGEALPWEDALDLTGPDPPNLVPRVPLRRRGIRILVSDLLRTQDPGPDLARLAHEAAGLTVLQLLDPWEVQPNAQGAVRLTDAETGATLEVDLDPETIATYRARLRRLQAVAARAVRSAGGTFCTVVAGPPQTMVLRDLLRARVLEPVA